MKVFVGFLIHKRWPRSAHDRRTNSLGAHSIERSSPDAEGSSLARSTMVPNLDDPDDASRRRVAVVFDRVYSPDFWRRTKVPGNWCGDGGGRGGNLPVPHAETCEPPEEALRDRASLLVVDLAAGQIFISVRAFDHIIRYRAFGRHVLSGPSGCPARRRFAHRILTNYPGHALFQRRAGWLRYWDFSRVLQL